MAKVDFSLYGTFNAAATSSSVAVIIIVVILLLSNNCRLNSPG